FNPAFLFSWPNAQTAVMGGRQAADVMAMVTEEGAKRRGAPVDPAQIEALKAQIVETFESQMSAFDTSGQALDDGVIDPRDTRRVLSFVLSVALEARSRDVVPMQCGVARP
ncbi:MAG: acyl-CoA carboxylase subunit beta, partial [Candidatus Eremiobacteraeota bacterium]|nr:acyl-CoA carboxylase subunit beta [Candidatus Eremiobacteraeota bacterium]